MFLRKFLKEPGRTQRNLLRGLLSKADSTEWGLRLGFEEIARKSDIVGAYRERVPLHSYEEMRTSIERIRNGEENILWPGRARYFAASSGTTSSGRIVPVSTEMLASNRQFSLAVFAQYLSKTRKTGILLGKHLSLPGWIQDDRTDLGTRIGQISAILAESSAGLARPWRAFDNSIGFIEDWEEKMDAVAEHTLGQDIRLIIIAPSWCQVLFKLVQERYKAKTGIDATIGDIWPNLSAVITGGVALSGYRDILSRYIGDKQVDMIETYGASEGFIAFQDDLSNPAMLLHLNNGVYYEFVPFDELRSDNPRRLSIDEVETGVRYAPHLTSNSGFWSYCVGDVVRFTSLDPHRIVVTGRTVDMLDKYGEAVFGDEAKAALITACEQTGAAVLHYHVTHTPAGLDRTPGHHWLIEFEVEPRDVARFAGILDDELKKAGHHYDDRREGMAFDRPTVTVLQPGTFFASMVSSGKRVTVQTKIPAMSEERDFAETVLKYVRGATAR